MSAANALESFFVSLGFQVDTTDIDKWQAKAEHVKSSMLGLGAVIGAAALGLGYFVEHMAESMGELAHFAEVNKVSAREVAAFTKVAVENDIAVGSAQETFASLNRKIGEAAIGLGRGKMIFKRLGLDAKDASGHVKSVNDMLDEIADKIKGQSRPEQLATLGKLGIDPNMVLLLEKGSTALKKMRAEAEAMNPISEEDYEMAEKVNKQFVKAKYAIGVFGKMLAVQIFPIANKILAVYLDWFKEMRKGTGGGMQTAFKALAAVLGSIWDWVYLLAKGVKDLVTWTLKHKIVVWALVAAFGALLAYRVGSWFIALSEGVVIATKALFAFNATAILPVIFIGGLVIAIGLLVDEIYNYWKGNETLIGQLQKKFPFAVFLAHAALVALVGIFIALKWQAILSVAATLVSVWSLAMGWISAFGSMAIATIAATWPILLIIAAVALVIGAVYLLWKHWDKITGWISTAWDVVTDKVMKFYNWVTKGVDKVKDMMGLSDQAAMQAVADSNGPDSAAIAAGNNSLNAAGGVIGRAGSNTNSTSSSTTTTHVNAPITIQTPDPARAGESVRDELNRAGRATTRNGQSAVAL